MNKILFSTLVFCLYFAKSTFIHAMDEEWDPEADPDAGPKIRFTNSDIRDQELRDAADLSKEYFQKYGVAPTTTRVANMMFMRAGDFQRSEATAQILVDGGIQGEDDY